MLTIDLRLYAILDRDIEQQFELADFTTMVIEGGATALQVRLKRESSRNIIGFTETVLSVARISDTAVIVNDRVDIALATGADGVHLGQDDMPVALARKICGAGMIVGVTVRDVESARAAYGAGADYLGVGPVFGTLVKPDLKPVGPDMIRAIRREISLPIVAIGGINDLNVAVPLANGADGVAVISALRQCHGPKEAASRLREAIDKAKKR
jgi:thiamine-phosphate pyrophosphorylase